ncbi:MAG TPA: SMP-30/gluconolactonase/LRE family protein [Pseudoxanthomonas sp.]|nr:SMP-30/gluconolactonase/LRE family protein [Pseudoxanthomonas sp.]
MVAAAVEAAARLAVDSRCAHGEGVLWCERRGLLLWVDIQGARLWLHAPADGRTLSWPLPDRPGCIGLAADGALLLALAKSLHRADLDAALRGGDLPLRHLADVEPYVPHTRSNDGRADRHGNFVFGTMNEHPDRARTGAFYQFSAAHGLRRLPLPGAAIPNSICFSHDGRTLYYCDSTVPEILCCDYDPDAARTGTPRLFARMDRRGAEPDGSTVDAEGGLWNAQWGASQVVRYRPDGSVACRVAVPVPQPSCCAIGGPDLDVLYVITSPLGLDAAALRDAPGSGGLYAVPLGRRLGLPESRVVLP